MLQHGPAEVKGVPGPRTLEIVTLIGGSAWFPMPLRASMRDAMAASAGGENWLKSCSASAGTAWKCWPDPVRSVHHL
jgi:hypothetical protein